MAYLVEHALQWADSPSLQLLRHLVGSDQPLPVVLVGTFRDSEVGSEQPLADVLAWLHRQPGVTRIGLLTLLAGGADHIVDADGLALRDALLREIDGNPFFVGELLRHLTETGAVYRDAEGRWTTRGELSERGLPVSVLEVIGRPVARRALNTRGGTGVVDRRGD